MAALRELLKQLALEGEPGARQVSIAGADPIVPSHHRLGAASAIALAAQGAAVAAIRKMRCDEDETVFVDVARAIYAMNGLECLRQNGYPVGVSFNVAEPGTGFYRTADGRFINSTTLRTNTRIALMAFMDSGTSNEAFARAVGRWKAADLEAVAIARGLPITMVRTSEEWRSHPHGRLLAGRPLIEIEKIAEGDPAPFRDFNGRTLSGVRVLDATHILGGPNVGRTLAEQGADVLRVSAPKQTDLLNMVMDTGFGKRSAYVDLDAKPGVDLFLKLADGADVFVDSYSPGSFAKRGITMEKLAGSRRGLVYVTISCYGAADGPFGKGVGFDSNAQAATGVSVTEGSAEQPKWPTTRLLADYLTGFLGAAGALSALIRRSREGGSYHVKLSLARTAMWVQDLGLVDPAMAPARPRPPIMMSMPSGFGQLGYLAPVTQFALSPSYWDKPPVPLGASRPEWL